MIRRGGIPQGLSSEDPLRDDSGMYDRALSLELRGLQVLESKSTAGDSVLRQAIQDLSIYSLTKVFLMKKDAAIFLFQQLLKLTFNESMRKKLINERDRSLSAATKLVAIVNERMKP